MKRSVRVAPDSDYEGFTIFHSFFFFCFHFSATIWTRWFSRNMRFMRLTTFSIYSPASGAHCFSTSRSLLTTLTGIHFLSLSLPLPGHRHAIMLVADLFENPTFDVSIGVFFVDFSDTWIARWSADQASMTRRQSWTRANWTEQWRRDGVSLAFTSYPSFIIFTGEI